MATEEFDYSMDEKVGEVNASYVNEAGFYEGVEIVNIEFTQLSEKTTGKQLIFTFQTDDNRLFKHVVFEDKPSDLRALVSSWGVKKSEINETVQRMHRNKMQSIYHILVAFVPREEIVFSAKSWTDLGKQVLKIAGELYEGETFKMKLVYDKKGNVRFPSYVKLPGFFLSMKDSTKLVQDKNDNFAKPESMKDDEYGINDADESLDDDADDDFEKALKEDKPKSEPKSEKKAEKKEEKKEKKKEPSHVTGEDDAPFDADSKKDAPEIEGDEDDLDAFFGGD